MAESTTTDMEWEKVLQEQKDKERAWIKCERKFIDLQQEFYTAKKEWHVKQKKREEIQGEWVEVVKTKRFRVNIMTLGLSYLLGFTSDMLKQYNYEMETAEAKRQDAILQLNYIVNVSKHSREIEERKEQLQSWYDQLKKRKYDSENYTRKLNRALDFSREVDSELERAKREQELMEEETKACILNIDDIKKKKEKLVEEALSVLKEIQKCEMNLSVITNNLSDSQTKVQECIHQLKVQSDSLKIADIVVAPAARSAQGLAILVGAAANLATLGLADIDIAGYGEAAKEFIDGGLPEKQEKLRRSERALNASDTTLKELQRILDGCKEELKRMQKITSMLQQSTESNTVWKTLISLCHLW